MAPVFAHGRLRLYLLKLLDETPRHGYEIIRLLEERFQGLYAPSAGTVYPRLAKLEAEGLVTHATEGGRKVYSITDAGREELAGRSGELADLELEIRDSVSELAAEIRDDVRGAAGKLRSEMRAAASRTRTSPGAEKAGGAGAGDRPEQAEKEEWARATHEWQEQARRAREDARQARRQAKEAQDKARREMQRIARQVQDQVQDHFARGDWPTGVREGLSELTAQLGGLTRGGMSWPSAAAPPPAPKREPAAGTPDRPAPDAPGTVSGEAEDDAVADRLTDTPVTGDPVRDLERLLDRFRDDIRDAARDHGVSESQLGEARRHLSTASAHIVASLLRPGKK